MSMPKDLAQVDDDNTNQQQKQQQNQQPNNNNNNNNSNSSNKVPPAFPGAKPLGVVEPPTNGDVYQRLKWNGWGTKNKWMTISPHDPMIVLHANGKPMRNLVPFAHQQINGGIGPVKPLEKSPCMPVEEAIRKLPQPVINEAFMSALTSAGLQEHQIKTDGESRLCHIFGKNYRDLWRVRKGMFERAPDVIVLPQSHDDCVKLMKCAVEHNTVLIPFGGGTNVTGGIEASPFDTRRSIVSVDLRRMNKMLAIDKTTRIATFECGVLGPDLDEAIGRHGFMFGHDPDSYIHSTLGGWIASRSSGALSNQYGDIEDMVLCLKVVTPVGVISTPLTSRPSGPDLNAMFLGSEGHFGIITEATVKIEPIPPRHHYEGWMFPTFEAGYNAFYECTRKGIHPTCMRLYDADDTCMSMALKTESPLIQKVAGKAIKQYLHQVKGWDLEQASLCIVGHEGEADYVRFMRNKTATVFKAHGGFCIGKGAGASWQEKKYDLPFVRDFALAHRMWADVFETSVLYSEALTIWREVKQAVRNVWKSENKKGWVGCHACHQYRFGCCLYFTYAGQQIDDNDMETFLRIKTAATEVMLRHKGNVTHHHGIGYEHVPWMERYLGTPAMELLLQFKRTVDPQDICNPHKLLPVQRKSGESDAEAAERRKKLMMFYRMGLPQKGETSKL